MSFNGVTGVIISPIHKPSDNYKPLYETFWKTCLKIRNILLQQKYKSETVIYNFNKIMKKIRKIK